MFVDVPWDCHARSREPATAGFALKRRWNLLWKFHSLARDDNTHNCHCEGEARSNLERTGWARWKEYAVFFEFGHSPQPSIGIATPSPSQRWGVVMTVKKRVCFFSTLRCTRVLKEVYLLFNTSLRCVAFVSKTTEEQLLNSQRRTVLIQNL